MAEKTDRDLADEVLGELRAGNWPDCQICGERDEMRYLGIFAHVPTFLCVRCSLFMGLDLVDG